MKELIKEFNKIHTKELYNKILITYIPNHNRCIYCNGPVFYYDSMFRISKKNIVYPDKKSYLTYKELYGIKYNLCVCEECLTKKFPEYQSKNKSKVFNLLNDISMYAFNIPLDIYTKWRKENYTRTLENFILKHGKDEGEKKWKIYCDKQALTNTYEYKKEKYGWSEKEFREYNKSRSVTIKNLIKRHGEVEGLKLWLNYIDRQRYTCSLAYFIEEYGEVEGNEKFLNFAKKRLNDKCYSEISQKIIKEIDNKMLNYETYYATKNHEYCFYTNDYCYHVDYYIKDLDIILEYNGDIWHGNPLIFKENDRPIPYNKSITAKELWEYDNIRLNFLKTKCKNIIIIWESEFKEKGLNNIINETINKINSYKWKT